MSQYAVHVLPRLRVDPLISSAPLILGLVRYCEGGASTAAPTDLAAPRKPHERVIGAHLEIRLEVARVQRPAAGCPPTRRGLIHVAAGALRTEVEPSTGKNRFTGAPGREQQR